MYLPEGDRNSPGGHILGGDPALPTSRDRTEPRQLLQREWAVGLPGKGAFEMCFVPIQAGSDKQVQGKKSRMVRQAEGTATGLCGEARL